MKHDTPRSSTRSVCEEYDEEWSKTHFSGACSGCVATGNAPNESKADSRGRGYARLLQK